MELHNITRFGADDPNTSAASQKKKPPTLQHFPHRQQINHLGNDLNCFNTRLQNVEAKNPIIKIKMNEMEEPKKKNEQVTTFSANLIQLYVIGYFFCFLSLLFLLLLLLFLIHHHFTCFIHFINNFLHFFFFSFFFTSYFHIILFWFSIELKTVVNLKQEMRWGEQRGSETAINDGVVRYWNDYERQKR